MEYEMQYIRNAWYGGAYSSEVTSTPLARTILDEPIVFFRDEDGVASALLDICPHRFAPLSLGPVLGGRLRCPYHGLEYDSAGRCVHNPHGNGARPTTLDIRAFPIEERDGFVWIWMGEKGPADTAAIPDFSFRTDEARRTIGGHARIYADYRLLVDNLMDLSHAQFLHSANVQNDAFHNIRREVKVEGHNIFNLLMIPNGSMMKLYEKFFDADQRLDMWQDIRWSPVSAMMNFIGVAPTGASKDVSLNSRGTHVITPETAGSCHYFFGSSRNHDISDPEVDELISGWQRQALMAEDKPVAEAIQARKAAVERHGMRRSMLAIDEAAVRVSREIDRMLADEAEEINSGLAEAAEPAL
jgi:phenylpropionate dioxygenase-like ring-hydroxylating dioxygenase large terminal subunit